MISLVAADVRQPIKRSRMEAAPLGTNLIDGNSGHIPADSIHDWRISDSFSSKRNTTNNAELPVATSSIEQEGSIFFCNGLDCEDDYDDESDRILREHECEASCYYSQSATLFEDDDLDRDFVSTSGRQTAIIQSSYGFLRLCHSVVSRASSRRSAVNGSRMSSQSFETTSRPSSVKGLLKKKAKLSIVMLRLLSQAKSSALERFAADINHTSSDSAEVDEIDSDYEDCIKTEAQSRFLLARRTSSMKRSILDFEARRERVQHLVQNGIVVVEHERASHPEIEKQGDLVTYEDDQLLLRSTIKRSPPFREKVMQLWTLILNAEKAPNMNKNLYQKLFTKISRLILDYYKREEVILRDICLDWDRDLKTSKESKYLSEETEALNFDSFCLVTIFELTDMFTTGCLLESYLDFVRRLCVGLFIQKDGKVFWRNDTDISYKHWLATRQRGNTGILKCRMSCLTQLPARSKTENEQLAGDVKRRTFSGLKIDARLPSFTSAFVLNDTIARMYRSKLVADLFVGGHTDYEPIPFDEFVVRYFALQFGSKAAARRHLRVFVLSCKECISNPAKKAENPRIDLFCTLAGLQLLPNSNEYNPRLASDFFFPALRLIFPNPRMIHDALREGNESSAMVPLTTMEKASTPHVFNYIIGGDIFLERLKKQSFCLSKLDLRKGMRVVNFDFFMVLALDFWVFADGFRSVREKIALAVLKRLFKQRKLNQISLLQEASPATPQTSENPEPSILLSAAHAKLPSKKKSKSIPAKKLAKIKVMDRRINKKKKLDANASKSLV